LGLSPFRIQVGEDLGDDVAAFETRNDSHCSGKDPAGLDVGVQSSVRYWCVTMDKLERPKRSLLAGGCRQ
jgi:hypothetical protein